MPYRVDGKKMMQLKNGKWELMMEHPSHEKALAHYRALILNVPEERERLKTWKKAKK